MDAQLTLRLPAELAQKLARSAKSMKRNRSDVMRLALEQFLSEPTPKRPIEVVRDLLGSVESGVPDLGQAHRAHLVQRLRRGR